MKFCLRRVRVALLVALTAGISGGLPQPASRDVKLPNGKSQREEILKADHEKDLADAAKLIELGKELQAELEKNDRHVLSVSSIRKTEEIEKLARRIRSRMRRF